MGFIANLFGGGSTTNKIVDGVMSGADALFYTDEEKAVANQKILDFKLEWMKATQGQNIARRLIAIGVTLAWLLAGVVVLTAKALGYDEFSKFAFEYLTSVITTPFMIIIGFYFAAHALKGIRK